MAGQLDNGRQYKFVFRALRLLAILLLAEGVASGVAAQTDSAELSYGGLRQDTASNFAVYYVKPDADFSVYDKLIIVEPDVTFRDGWRLDHRQQANVNDMSRVERVMAESYRDGFIEVLQDEGGYEIVEEKGEDVLLILSAIVDLDVASIPGAVGGFMNSYSASGTAATLVLELFDSTSGEILARAVDRQTSTDVVGYRSQAEAQVTWNSFRREAGRLFTGWAGNLRDQLGGARAN